MQAIDLQAPRPRIAIVCDSTQFHGHPAHLCLDGYVHAVIQHAGAVPWLLPAVPNLDLSSFINPIDGIDGLLLPGSPSNVAAERYGQAPLPDHIATDLERDALVFKLLPQVLAAGIPVLGICRGFQELNVALGGTLDPAVHTRACRIDHREGDHERPIEAWYADAHAIEIQPGGLLAKLSHDTHVMVNSLHHQGIDRLGAGLRIEAVASDGLIEAISVIDSVSFACGVQWHPEMRTQDSELARQLFLSFGQACRSYQEQRLRSR